MADEKDRLGDKLYQAERGREDQWARQRDAEIIERLRRKYSKAIHCPRCGKSLDARVAIGVGGMACRDHHGAWGDQETLMQIVARLKNAAAIAPKSFSKGISTELQQLIEDERHRHPQEIDCPDCGTRLDAEAALSPGAQGLAGMACPKGHGAWLDEDMLTEIRKRLDVAAKHR
jgi:Zn-finger nucleic acid-binding protein